MQLWLAISGFILLMCIIALAILLKQDKSKPPPRQQIKKIALPPKPTKPTVPQGKNVQDFVATEKRKRMREQTRQWVVQNPKKAVKMIRFWLHQG